MQLRPYQQEAVDKIVDGFSDFGSQLLVMATGAGKSIVFSKLIERMRRDGMRKPALIVAHRDELIQQAVDKLYRSTKIPAGIEKAQYRAKASDPVVVASVQTLVARGERWARDHFGLVVVDEAHHALSPSYRKSVIDYFCGEEGGAKLVGVTATPDRGDKKELGTVFDSIAYEIGIAELVRDGYLCPIRAKTLPIQIDLTSIRTIAGDYSEAELGHALEPYLPEIAAKVADELSSTNRRALAFLPLISTSEHFTEHLVNAGIKAEHIDGTFSQEDRRDTLARFARGEIQVLSNSMLLTEGYDDIGLDTIIVLRPTQIRSLYAQMVGRGTRVNTEDPEKTLLLLDFLWMSEKHNLTKKHRLVKPADLIAANREEADEMSEEIDAATSGDGLDLLGTQGNVREQREAKLAKELARNAKRKSRVLDPLEVGLLIHDESIYDFEPTMRWHKEEVSERQAAALERMGVDVEGVKSRGQASAILDAAVNRSKAGLATIKQVKYLKQFGHPSPEKATFEEAKKFLDDAFSGKGGQRPAQAPRGPALQDLVLTALRVVAANDGDRASIQNGRGFGKFDGEFGHSLAAQRSLSPKQVQAGLKLALRYRRQLPDDLVQALEKA